MAINVESYLLHDSCRTTKLLTVCLGLMETGRKWPVIEEKAVHNDEIWKSTGVKIIKADIILQKVDQIQVTWSGSHLYYGFKVPKLLGEPVEAVYTKSYWKKAKILREKAITFGWEGRSSYCNSLLKKQNKKETCLFLFVQRKNNQWIT